VGISPGEAHGALDRALRSGECAEQGGFSGAVRSDQADKLPGGNPQVEVFMDDLPAVSSRQFVSL
jgi:hypothetical protein